MSLQSELYMNISVTEAQPVTIEQFKIYPSAFMIFTKAGCMMIMLIGVFGNIITIAALARYEKVQNATAIFIMNLSCSDLIFCSFNLLLATSTFYRRTWMIGPFLCRLYPLTKNALVANSLFIVLIITITRYIMVAHPQLYTKLYKKRNIIIIQVCTWLLSIGIMVSHFLNNYSYYYVDEIRGICSIVEGHRNRSLRKVLILTAFILPCTAIIICYARIFCIVRKATEKSLKTKRHNVVPPVRANSETSCNYGAKPLETPIPINTKITISDNIIRQQEKLKEPPSFRRIGIQKSIKFLKMSLPTRKDRRLGTMIIAIMITFCLGYLPITITQVIGEINPHPKSNFAAHILLCLSSSINPIIYVVMSNEYRKAYKNLFERSKTSLTVNKIKSTLT